MYTFSAYWKRLSILAKLVLPMTLVSLLTAVVLFMFFVRTFNQKSEDDFVDKARTIIMSAESAREFASQQYQHNVFRTDLKSSEAVLHTVPIFAAMEVAKKKAESLRYQVKVPRTNPRNPDNTPDGFENEALQKLQAGNLSEYYQFDESTGKLRFFRPVRLTQECMQCHGDPATSVALWNNADGKDITGHRMENKRVGDFHGAFEILMSTDAIRAESRNKAFVIAGISGLSAGFLIFVLFFIARSISRPVQELAEAARRGAQGEQVQVSVQTEDEIGDLANSFNTMTGTLISGIKAQQAYLEQSISTMLHGIERFSHGDLTVHLEVERNDDIGRLFTAFNNALVSVRGVMTRVLEVAGQTASAAAQISASIEEMSSGMAEQNRQVSEVTGTISEMTDTIQQNSRSASTAAEAARQAEGIAQMGGDDYERNNHGHESSCRNSIELGFDHS